MRLLHAESRTLKSFEGTEIPPYTILSHTWGLEEVTYQDITTPEENRPRIAESPLFSDHVSRDHEVNHLRRKRGEDKIDRVCSQSYHDGVAWVWIDTCCIDKSSSSELSDAINSMFQWYKDAALCYVFLEDVSCEDLEPSDGSARSKLEIIGAARWFSRGWTLQELIASEKIHFFSFVPDKSEWRFIGSKVSEVDLLSSITGIDRSVLEEPSLLSTMSVARRMSWAAFRQTTRIEDIAYCLLGIFQVNMPLLYGEGNSAFIRLQEEILKSSEDECLFAWTDPEASVCCLSNDGILATHPNAFRNSCRILPYRSLLEPCAMTNRGLRMQSRLIPFIDTNSSYRHSHSCILHCRYEDSFENSISVAVERDISTGRYRRSSHKSLRTIDYNMAKSALVSVIYIHKWGPLQTRDNRPCYLRRYPESDGFKLETAIASKIEVAGTLGEPSLDEFPPWVLAKDQFSWNMKQRVLVSPPSEHGYFSALQFLRVSSHEDNSSYGGFVAILRISSGYEGAGNGNPSGVLLIPRMKTPFTSKLIHSSLKASFQRIESCKSTLKFGDGVVTAWLTKENQFDDTVFVLDIEYTESRGPTPPEVEATVLTRPAIRVFDAQDRDVTPQF
jgi:hypothetical protein